MRDAIQKGFPFKISYIYLLICQTVNNSTKFVCVNMSISLPRSFQHVTRESMEVIVTIVSKLVERTYFGGRNQPIYLGVK